MRLDANQTLFGKLAFVAVAMFGFGYALVPFYEQICAAWGINSLGQVREAPSSTQVDRNRLVTIEFDSNAHGLPWRFKPMVRHLQVHPGEMTFVEYEVSNVQGEPVTGLAIPSYGPQLAGEYFKKVECFCFTQQTLAAGETRRMPVVFVIDPKLPKDVNTVAISYTFFEVAGRGGKS